GHFQEEPEQAFRGQRVADVDEAGGAAGVAREAERAVGDAAQRAGAHAVEEGGVGAQGHAGGDRRQVGVAVGGGGGGGWAGRGVGGGGGEGGVRGGARRPGRPGRRRAGRTGAVAASTRGWLSYHCLLGTAFGRRALTGASD